MEEYEIINIPISDGTEREFAIMNTFQVAGKNYVAVSLVDGEEIQDGVYIYRYTDVEDSDMIVETITDKAVYNSAV